jgi:hypothetical protein
VWNKVTFSCNQNLNTKYLKRLWQNTSCSVKNKTPDQASVIAHGALKFADRSQEKFRRVQIVRCCSPALYLGFMALVPTCPCSQLASLSPSPPHYHSKDTIFEKELFNTKYDLIFSTAIVRTFLTLQIILWDINFKVKGFHILHPSFLTYCKGT